MARSSCVKKMKKTKVVIAGGGFASLYAARYLDKPLARRADVDVSSRRCCTRWQQEIFCSAQKSSN